MSGFPLSSTNRYKRYNSKSIGGPWQLLTRLVLHLLEQNVFSLFARESIERVCATGLQRGRWDGLKNKKSTNYRNRVDKEAKIMMRVSQGCTHIYTHTHTYFLCMCAFNLTSFMFPFFFFFFHSWMTGTPVERFHPKHLVPGTERRNPNMTRYGRTTWWPPHLNANELNTDAHKLLWVFFLFVCFFFYFQSHHFFLIDKILYRPNLNPKWIVMWEPTFLLASPPSGAIFEQTLWKGPLGCPNSI